MEASARRRPLSAIVRAVARRPGIWATMLVVLLVAGLWIWWATQLWGLPDIGDPFDVAAFEAFHVPDDRNAFHWYRDAASMTSTTRNKIQANDPFQSLQRDPANWQAANPVWRDF